MNENTNVLAVMLMAGLAYVAFGPVGLFVVGLLLLIRQK